MNASKLYQYRSSRAKSHRDINYILTLLSPTEFDTVEATLQAANPLTDLLRPRIETPWEAIAEADNWQPFYDLVQKLQTGN